jgi:uncharacterized protein YndB with AHSA1/START domain
MSESPHGLVLRLSRVLGAPIERVFTMLTEPGELAQWWGPSGFTVPELKVSLRPGGHYRFTMAPPEGEPFHLSGEFLDIAAPTRLVYTFRWDEPDPDDRETVVTLTLTDVGGATELSLSQGEFATEDRLALHRNGWSESLDKLQALLGGEPA